MQEDFVSPPRALMAIMGIEPAPAIDAAAAYALEGADQATLDWYSSSGPDAWTPVHVYAGMSGLDSDAKLSRAALAASMQTLSSIAVDVDGIPGEISPPGPPGTCGRWSGSWTRIPEDRLGDPDLVCMAVDWTISILVANGRIVGPISREQLDSIREEAVLAISDEEMGPDPVFGHLVQPAAVAMIRMAGIRMPGIDRQRIGVLQHVFPTRSALDEVTAAWTGHFLVHRRLHEEMVLRHLDRGSVMAFAEVLLSIDTEAAGRRADAAGGAAMALHAVHDAIRTMLLKDIYDVEETHLFSESLGDRTPGDLASLITGRDEPTLRLVDGLTRRAFARRMMQCLSTPPHLVDEPYLLANARSILLVELGRQDQDRDLSIGMVEWSIGLAVATIVDSQADEMPHDPVWRTIARDLSDDDTTRTNPHPLSSEALDSMRTGVSASRGRLTITGIVVHCVDPDQDRETQATVASIVPGAVEVVPGDVQMTRIARIEPWRCDLDDGVAVAERLREECDVHGAHVIGTLDGRACLIDSHEGHDVEIHVGAVRPSWN